MFYFNQHRGLARLEAFYWTTVIIAIYASDKMSALGILGKQRLRHHSGTLIHSALFWQAVLLILGFFALFIAFRNLKALMTLDDTPKSKLSSAAQGYIALQGFGETEADNPIVSPLTCTECIWYSYTIKKRQGNSWETIDSGLSNDMFWLKDDSAKCLVDPEGAEVYPKRLKQWYGSAPQPFDSMDVPDQGPNFFSLIMSIFQEYQYSENLILAEDEIYILGVFGTVNNKLTATGGSNGQLTLEHHQEVLDLLSQWRADYPALLAKFDLDKDGDLNASEYDQVVLAAEAEIQKKYHAQATISPTKTWSAINVVSNKGLPDDKSFMISSLTSKKMDLKFRLGVLLYSATFLLFLVMAFHAGDV